MNPILKRNLESIARIALGALFGWLVKRGYLSGEDSTYFIEVCSVGLVAVGWAVYHNHKEHKLKEWLWSLVSGEGGVSRGLPFSMQPGQTYTVTIGDGDSKEPPKP